MAQPPPEAWIGLNVEASIVHPVNDGRFGLPTGLSASLRTGRLEAVNSMGIVASLWSDPDDPEEEAPVSTFYPWSAVLFLHPESPES